MHTTHFAAKNARHPPRFVMAAASNVSQYLASASLRHWDFARPAVGSHSQLGIPQFVLQWTS
jgi:hypothetical protein